MGELSLRRAARRLRLASPAAHRKKKIWHHDQKRIHIMLQKSVINAIEQFKERYGYGYFNRALETLVMVGLRAFEQAEKAKRKRG